ncbi:hypothetical protein C4D60_Mb09t06670 [Musa balbisiana]|uniref:RING-type E3 ubiquitin transferase n=1 Tax=Musa balbisiana TaxID=52838 RepID=A0A4S8IFV0_MUSBA|nr:hypothetical protein C4D60_Mb09t06670 [Musa balbisiana]
MRFLSRHAENLRSVTGVNQLNDLGECVPLSEILVVIIFVDIGLSEWDMDDGNGRVYVVGARGDPGLPLTVASEDFEKSGKYCSTCGCETLDNQRGREMLGVQQRKKILPVGTTLTIVGEAIKGDDGKIQIQKPHKGTVYVSRMNIDQLIEDYGNNARLYLVLLVYLFINT